MNRKPNIHGGGSKTNFNGLSFEKRTSFLDSLKKHNKIRTVDKISHSEIYYLDKLNGYYTEKNNFYNFFLKKEEVNWKGLISKKYLPDAVFINMLNNKIYIIEKKFQAGSGSVDEKLQTCDFKKKIYKKLVDKCKNKYITEYYYILNNWFLRKEYDDVKNYIRSVNCNYFVNKINFNDLGIGK